MRSRLALVAAGRVHGLLLTFSAGCFRVDYKTDPYLDIAAQPASATPHPTRSNPVHQVTR